MKKVNPYTGLGILLGVIGLLLFWMKVDSKGIVLLVFFLIFGSVLVGQLFQKKIWNHRWGYILLVLGVVVILQSLTSLVTQEFYLRGILIAAAMYTLIYRTIYPRQSF